MVQGSASNQSRRVIFQIMHKHKLVSIGLLAVVMMAAAGNAFADFTIQAGETYTLSASETLTVDGNLTIAATGTRSSTRVLSLFTAWPPGPPPRENE